MYEQSRRCTTPWTEEEKRITESREGKKQETQENKVMQYRQNLLREAFRVKINLDDKQLYHNHEQKKYKKTMNVKSLQK